MKRDWLLWTAFVVVCVALALLAPLGALGDVTLYYEPWAISSVFGNNVPGIDSAWVYPVLAMVPVALPLLGGPHNYALLWLLLVESLNAVAFFAILSTQGRTGGTRAGWWWLLFLVLLGSLSLTRLDSIAAPLSIIGLLYAGRRPVLAASLLTVGAWIKVWPALLFGSFAIARPNWRTFRIAAGISATIVLIAIVLGSGMNIASFAGFQGQRELEIGAPIATVWLWLAFAGVLDSRVVYNGELKAFEVTGNGAVVAGDIVTGLSILAIVAVVLVALRARSRGVAADRLLVHLSLALLLVAIVLNKVGSPQYLTILAVPVVVALALGIEGFGVPVVLVAIGAALTQIIFPWFFDELVGLRSWMLAVITIRNGVLLTLFVWSILAMGSLGRRSDAQMEAGIDSPGPVANARHR